MHSDYKKHSSGHRQQSIPYIIMSKDREITKQDKLVLTITLAGYLLGYLA